MFGVFVGSGPEDEEKPELFTRGLVVLDDKLFEVIIGSVFFMFFIGLTLFFLLFSADDERVKAADDLGDSTFDETAEFADDLN